MLLAGAATLRCPILLRTLGSAGDGRDRVAQVETTYIERLLELGYEDWHVA